MEVQLRLGLSRLGLCQVRGHTSYAKEMIFFFQVRVKQVRVKQVRVKQVRVKQVRVKQVRVRVRVRVNAQPRVQPNR